MTMKQKMIAMILAGGQGSRLGKLTQETAKPALSFGGSYRIIDFPLSNCVNSHIDTVGVVTQYQPLALNEHVGNGSSWGLDSKTGGVSILQPYSSMDGEKWFQGTAHAIYQNISFIDLKNPDYLLVLSGDHIYKMDYDKMLQFHQNKKASLTVGVIKVPMEEASRFGIMNTDETNRIIDFDEKPKQPKNDLASMGIYIFDWPKLRSYLVNSYATDRRLEDFGKNVIPAYINAGEKVFAYAFSGYWKDVGTIQSLWEANMEFLSPQHELNISDRSWKIYSKNTALPPMFFTENAKVIDSMVVDGCYIDGTVEHSILSKNVRLRKNSKIKHSVIMDNAIIGENVRIEYAIVGEEALISDNAVILGKKDDIQVVGFKELIGGLKQDES